MTLAVQGLSLPKEMTIRGGPSRWDLMLALFDGDELHRRTVTFTAFFSEFPGGSEPRRDTDVTFETVIDKLERYGTGLEQFHEWSFEGGVKKVNDSPFACRVSGQFDTSIRSGNLYLEDSPLWFVGRLEDGKTEVFSAPSREAACSDPRYAYIFGPYRSREEAEV